MLVVGALVVLGTMLGFGMNKTTLHALYLPKPAVQVNSTQPTLVSVVMESSGQENATILASLSALMSPSTSRLNTIPGTTSEL